ncbi:hypothetical protein llap_17216 [Limosa lapponica baueri]|uniref:Uncharacterized protein n=1 Tax=Limosa lapponica baueri TaxID=1758121 RepID=A0A2I0TFB6_LIMLA|nr:hypothetical protein llap_17216 [Limosa lapponica baueri]
MFQAPNHLCGPLLYPLQQFSVLLELGSPELDTVLQMGLHQRRAEGQDNLSRPAGHTLPDAPQDAIDLLGHKGTLLMLYCCPPVLAGLFPQSCSPEDGEPPVSMTALVMFSGPGLCHFAEVNECSSEKMSAHGKGLQAGNTHGTTGLQGLQMNQF